MLTVKFGEKELNIKFGYEATVKNNIIKKLANLEKQEDGIESVNNILMLLPELILVGLQKYHYDEYGFDPYNKEQKEEKLSEVYSMLDDYFDSDESDIQKLFADVQGELLENGFLAKLLKQEQEKNPKKAQKKSEN